MRNSILSFLYIFILLQFALSNPGIVIGNESSVISVDIFCQPGSSDTFFFFQNIIPIIDNYSNYAKITFYLAPVVLSHSSSVLTRLVYSISSTNINKSQMIKLLKFIFGTNNLNIQFPSDYSDQLILENYAKIIENALGISSSEIKGEYMKEIGKKRAEETKKLITTKKIKKLPSVFFNLIEVRSDALKAFFFDNLDYIIKVVSRKSNRSFRKNKDKKGLETYTKLIFGKDPAIIHLDLYFDPIDDKSTSLIEQVSTILSKYSDVTQVILHPTATSKPFSFQLVRLILAVKNIDISKGISFIYWLCIHKNELLSNMNTFDENEIISSIISRANIEVQIDRAALLQNYLKGETLAETLGSTFDLKLEKIDSLPYAKINGYSISFNEQEDMSLFNIFNELVQIPNTMKFNEEL